MKNSRRRRAVIVAKSANIRTTLGELIAVAFDIAGNQVTDVAHLLASPQLGRAAHGRIVLVH